MKQIFTDIDTIILLVATIGLVILFSFLSPHFLTARNVQVVVNNMSILTILALGLTPILIAGEIDVSFTSALELSAMVAALLSPNHFLILVVASLLAVAILGALNGVLSVYVGVPSFLVTLATMTGVHGLVLLISNYRVQMIRSDWLAAVFYGEVMGSISTAVYWMIGFIVLFVVYLEWTKYGRWVYSTGGNERSSMLLGVPTRKVKFSLFVICSVVAGVAGLIAGSRSAAARPLLGEGYLISVIAAPILGGASLTGGVGSIAKTVLACLLLTVITNGVNIIGLQPAYRELFLAVVLAGALSIKALE